MAHRRVTADARRSAEAIRSRWPTVGLALAVVADGRTADAAGSGLTDVASRAPATEDTVFRVVSVTKTFTATAEMDLVERGVVDLDAPVAVPPYEVVTVGGAAWSTAADLAPFVAARLAGGAGERGRVLEPGTVAAMLGPQLRPDPRVPGLGFGFLRFDLGGRAGVEHDDILPGLDAQISLALDDGVAVVELANGARRGMHWLTPEVGSLLGELVGVPVPVVRTDLPQRPESGPTCAAGTGSPITPRTPLGSRSGPERGCGSASPIRALARGRVVFRRRPGSPADAMHLDFAPLSFRGEGGSWRDSLSGTRR